MQRVQISQMLEPTNDKNEIWIASPLEDIQKKYNMRRTNYKLRKG